MSVYLKALRTGKSDRLATWLSPELVFQGGDSLVRVSDAEGRERVLIGIYALHLMASDIAVEVLSGWPARKAMRADLRIKLSGTWKARGRSFTAGQAFTVVSTLSFEFADGVITKLIERR